MNILVVYAHPNPQSYNAALFRLACEQLALAGHNVHPLDLYEIDFEARMSCEQRVNYMTRDNTKGVENHAAKLKWAQAVVFVYPTWWMGPPAILKGWLDRVWLPGLVATYGPNGLEPGLTQIKKFLIITTQGSSQWRMALVGNPPRKMFRLSLKAVSRCKDIKWLALYNIDKTTEEDRKKFMEKVSKHLQSF